MILTKKQAEEMLEVAAPLMEWLSYHFDLRCKAIVDAGSITLMEEVSTRRTDEFIED